MAHLKLTMFKASSLAAPEYAEAFYEILSGWDFPPTVFDEYEPIKTDWHNRGQFLKSWANQAKSYFGQVLVRRNSPT